MVDLCKLQQGKPNVANKMLGGWIFFLVACGQWLKSWLTIDCLYLNKGNIVNRLNHNQNYNHNLDGWNKFLNILKIHVPPKSTYDFYFFIFENWGGNIPKPLFSCCFCCFEKNSPRCENFATIVFCGVGNIHNTLTWVVVVM